jgi:hypothetical protein
MAPCGNIDETFFGKEIAQLPRDIFRISNQQLVVKKMVFF